MEIAAIITVCECFCAVKLSAVISVTSFVHIAKARNKFKTIFTLAELADSALGIGVVKFVNTLFVLKFLVEFIF